MIKISWKILSYFFFLYKSVNDLHDKNVTVIPSNDNGSENISIIGFIYLVEHILPKGISHGDEGKDSLDSSSSSSITIEVYE